MSRTKQIAQKSIGRKSVAILRPNVGNKQPKYIRKQGLSDIVGKHSKRPSKSGIVIGLGSRLSLKSDVIKGQPIF
jgi:hypothetical protein